jgi:predicted outer membrane protein
MSAKDNATKERLSQLHGEAFDKGYWKDMVTDHRQDIAEFKHESARVAIRR